MLRNDDLPLPPPLRPPEALVGPGDALGHAAAARDRPFSLTTARVHVTGSELRGARAATADGWPLLADLTSGGGACAGVVIGPSALRRELVGAGGSVLETLLAGDRAAGLVAQWRAPAPGGAPTLSLTWSVPLVAAGDDGESPPGWRAEGALLGVRRRLAAGDPGHLLFQVTPAPAWTLAVGNGALRVEATVRLSPGGHATLLGALGRDAADAAAALAVLRATSALEVRAERAAEELRSERLALDTGVRELDDALPWATVRLRGALTPTGFRRGSGCGEAPSGGAFPFDAASEHAWSGLGALAAGETAAARHAASGSLGHPLRALLLGWLVAWTGDAGLLDARRVDALQAAAGLDARTLGPAQRVVWRAALDAWLDAAESLGGPPWAGALQARRDTLGEGEAPAARGVRLPMAGAAPPGGEGDGDAALLAALLGGPEAEAYRTPAREPRSAVERALRAWAAYATGRHDEGFGWLRAHLAGAFEHVPGAWRAAPDDPCWDHTAAAGLAPAATLFGLLGARADASYGRLRLAPRIPGHWTRLTVRGLRIGKEQVQVAYARHGAGHTFGIRQIGGRVPLMLVFEPEVPSGGPVRVRVDGSPADVGTEPAGTRVRVRLQLPLDRDREIRVEPDDAEGEPAPAPA